MSRQLNDDTPRDWRRRRSRERPADSSSAAADDGDAGALAEQSRTLFSFIEPLFDFITVFYAPILIAGLVGIVAGATLLAFVPAMRLYGGIALGIGAVLVLLVALSYFSRVVAAFFSRTGRYGVNTVIMTAAFIGLVALVNYVAFENNIRADTTATNQFSLADRTRDLLDRLDRPISIIAFYPDQIGDLQVLTRRGKVATMLREFSKRSGNITYQFLDQQKEADLARSLGVTADETLAVSAVGAGVTDLIQPTDPAFSRLEQDLYTALLVATGAERKKVYFLSGHGERDIALDAEGGYSQITQGLEVDNYEVAPLVWSPSDDEVAVPDDAALLVIAGPTGELPEAHANALNAYMAGRELDGVARREGPRLIFLAEPNTDDSFKGFLASLGVLVDDGYIRDTELSQPNAPRTLRLGRRQYVAVDSKSYSEIRDSLRDRPDYESTPVLESIQALSEIVAPRGINLKESYLHGAVPIVAGQIVEEYGTIYSVPIAITSQSSWAIDEIERIDPADDDPQGPFFPAWYVYIALPATGVNPGVRFPNEIANMVVFGDADFIANGNVQRGSGAALFLNSANYLMGDYSLVSIRDREFVYREWNLDRNERNFVRFSTWLLLPGRMGLMAVVVWWVRR